MKNAVYSLMICAAMWTLPVHHTIIAQTNANLKAQAESVNTDVVNWRRHFHQYPELSNREFKTAERIAQELRNMGLQVETGIAITGVVGLLDTGRPGPTIGLRADIDALPVLERAPIPYASKEMGEYLGQKVPVMHACGHDTHIAMLLGTAKVLTQMKDKLKGKVVFVFQPAEEGSPPGEEGGAKLMVKEGLITKYGIDVMFGQHINSDTPVGTLKYKFGGLLAAADVYTIRVNGKQSHGSQPWGGVDPITVAAQIIQGLNNIISRQTNLTKEAAVISVGKIEGGVRNNIIPEKVEITGTIRTLDVGMQDEIHRRIKQTATYIAQSAGATADVEIIKYVPVTYNNIPLTQKMLPSLFTAVGETNVQVMPATTGGEDFAFFANEIPSMFWFTGGRDPKASADVVYPHHTPDFQIDDSGLVHGVKAFLQVTWDYMYPTPMNNDRP